MDSMLEDEYKAGLRRLLTEHGRVVKINEDWRKRSPRNPEAWVSEFGWEDHDADQHVHVPTPRDLATWGKQAREFYGSCGLYIPPGVQLQEVVYGEFCGTDVPGEDNLGINAYGGNERSETQIRCNCGKYRGLTVRWEGSLQEALCEVLGLNRISFTL